MKVHGVQRLISLTGGGVRDAAQDQPGFMDKLIVLIMKHMASKGSRAAQMDGSAHAALIRESKLDWTIVRGFAENPVNAFRAMLLAVFHC